MDERRDLVDREELRRAVVKAFADHFPMAAYDRLNRAADAVLAVPAIADALARDAQVAEIVVRPSMFHDGMRPTPNECAVMMADIAALHSPPGDRDDSEECARCAALFASYGERFPDGSVVRCHIHRPISEEQR